MQLEFDRLEHENRELIYTLDASPDGRLLAVGQQSDKEGHAYLTLWDLESRSILRPVEAGRPQRLIFRCRFAPDGKTLAYVKSDSAVYFHDVESGETFKPEQPDDNIRWLSYSASANRLVTAGSLVQVWDAERREVLHASEAGAAPAQARDQTVVAALSPDGAQLAVAGDGTGKVSLRDALSGAEIATLVGAPALARWVSFDPHGRYLAVIEFYSHGVFLWDLHSGQRVLTETFGERADGYWALSFHPDGEQLALGTTSDYLTIARLSDGKLIFDQSVHQGRIWDMTYTRDGDRLIFGGDEGVAYVGRLNSSDISIVGGARDGAESKQEKR